MKRHEMEKIIRRHIELGDVIEIYGEIVRILDFYRYGAIVESEENGIRSFFSWDDLMNARGLF